jgi:ribonucleoside-diphosphate reductase alpha chain
MGEENPRLYKNYDREITKSLEEKLKGHPFEPEFSENAISILKKRYFKKDENGTPQEDVKGLFSRVAANIAYPDFYYSNGNEAKMYETAKRFYEMMIKKEFMPNSPSLMNASRNIQQLSACFVLPIEDSMESIFNGVYNAAMIHKSGGGTGFSFSKIRRKNDFVSTTHGKASGPLSFIIAYDSATHSVKQGGTRRGANMGMLRIDHPDILEFIHAKENERDRRFENFNFSVLITDEFMKALEENKRYVLKNPRNGKLYELTVEDLKREKESVKKGLIDGKERILILDDNNNVIYQNPIKMNQRGCVEKIEKKIVGKVDENGRITFDASIIFNEIARLAHKNGEPGVVFIDRINEHNPVPKEGIIEATNPCGEQPLLPYEACNLGSINLGLMVKDGKINYQKLEETVKDAVHFLDNVIDMSNFTIPFPKERIKETATILYKLLKENGIKKDYAKLEERVLDELGKCIETTVRMNRKIGLGIMGWADMLVKLGIQYNSEKAIRTAEDVMRLIKEKGIEESQRLAEERGAFPNFNKSIYYGKEKPRRNATITTIAPTGTISIIADTSSGIEPFFNLIYTHTDASGKKREFINKSLKEDLEKKEINAKKVIDEISKGKKLSELHFVPEEIKKIYVTTADISVDYHVKMQAAFQKHTDNAVSKTINMPDSSTVDDVKKAYLLAYKLGCKGITVYREGSREIQVLEAPKKKKLNLENRVKIKPKELPKIMPSIKITQNTPWGNMHVSIIYEPKTYDIKEIFVELGRPGQHINAMAETIGRLASIAYRSNIDESIVKKQLTEVASRIGIPTREGQISSIPEACEKVLTKFEKLRENGLLEKIALGEVDVDKISEIAADMIRKSENNSIRTSKDDEIGEMKCPECNGKIIFEEGCQKCYCCGYSRC